MFAPKGTPEPVLAKLEAACRSAMAATAVVEGLGKQQQGIDFRDRAGLGAFVATEFKQARALLDEAGLVAK